MPELIGRYSSSHWEVGHMPELIGCYSLSHWEVGHMPELIGRYSLSHWHYFHVVRARNILSGSLRLEIQAKQKDISVCKMMPKHCKTIASI